MPKTIEEINERIRSGQVVVVDAEEIIDIVEEKGAERAAKEVDVVTTGTFGPMCSSGAFLNLGHTRPRMKFAKATLNNVPAYTGIAAVDVFLGATEPVEGDPGNRIHPGGFEYGGGHVIEELVAGHDIEFYAESDGSDCYPRRSLRSWVRLDDMNQAVLTNPRNAYQNYNVAVNTDEKRVLYTYMGVLQPNLANATYCSAGQLSPLLNDPLYRTVGVGTRLFLGGGVGHVWWEGTQHAPGVKRNPAGAPVAPAGTLAVCGDLKQMSAEWLRGVSVTGYGVSLAVGVGIPIPILDEEVVKACAVRDEDLTAPVVDYATAYPEREPKSLGTVTYKQLKSGTITVRGQEVPTAALSSYARAREIAAILKEWIRKGEFLLARPVSPLTGADTGQTCRPFTERQVANHLNHRDRQGRNARRR